MMKNNILKEVIELKGVGQVKFFTSKDNKSRRLLEDVQRNTNTYICEYSEDDNIQPQSGQTFMEAVINDHVTVRLVLGSIVAVTDADVIVNAANNRLQHSGGVAAVISNAAGPSMQAECNDYIKQNGEIETSKLYVSGPGKLDFKAILHAVGPIFNKFQSNERNLLYNTMYNIMKTCEDRKWSNVALPAISTGIYGFPLDKAAEIIIESIEDFTSGSKNIKIIQIVDLNANVIKEFQSVLKSRLSVKIKSSSELNHKLQLQKVQPLPSNAKILKIKNFVKPISNQKVDEGKNKIITSSTSKIKTNHVPLRLFKGKLVDQIVDAIVNSAASDINLNRGTIAKMILTVGGQEIQDECDMYVQSHGNLNYGDVAVTNGYNLPCRYIFHGVCAPWNNITGPCEMSIKKLVNKSLETADQLNLTSIAMPSFGTGQLKVPPEYVAKWMYEATDEYFAKNPRSKLNDLRVVVYEKDIPTVKAFEDFLNGSSREKSTSKISSRHLKNDIKRNEVGLFSGEMEKGSTITLGNVVLEICQGNITEETTDAIVNSTDKCFNQLGNVSQAILKNGGDALKKEYSKIDKVNRIIRTNAGDLHARYIYHVDAYASPNWSIIEECLTKADEDKITSISFPLLGTGIIAKDSSDMANIFLNATSKFSGTNPKCLNKVRIVIFQDAMVSEFKNVIQSKVNPGFIQRLLNRFSTTESTSYAGVVMNDYISPKINPTTIKLIIYSLSKDNINQAKVELHSALDDHITKKKLTDSWKDIISKLSADEVKYMNEMYKNNSVEIKIDTSNGTIEINGLIKDVDNVYDKIIESLNVKKSKMEETKETENVIKQVKWMFLDDYEYKEYPKEIAFIIEKAFHVKNKSAQWEEDDGKFEVKFDDMKEYAPNNSTTPVKRVPNGCTLPLTWDHMFENELIKKVKISPQSDEYKSVEANIRSTSTILNSIVEIERIQNVSMYKQYAVGRDSLDKIYKQNPAVIVERTLWHGTSAETISPIINEGFNRSYSGKNATCYGQGSYFARDFNYSAQNIYSKPDFHGHKYIFQCKVLTGEFIQGHQSYKVPPLKQGSATKYDSVVDNVSNPSIYVVFNDTYAYPEYIIKFT